MRVKVRREAGFRGLVIWVSTGIENMQVLPATISPNGPDHCLNALIYTSDPMPLASPGAAKSK